MHCLRMSWTTINITCSMYDHPNTGLLLLLQLRHYSALQRLDQERPCPSKKAQFWRIQLSQPHGQLYSLLGPPLPNGRRQPQLLPVQLGHEEPQGHPLRARRSAVLIQSTCYKHSIIILSTSYKQELSSNKAFFGEQGLQRVIFVHLLKNVATTHELSVDVKLRVGRPAAEHLDLLPYHRVIQHVNRLVLV